MGGDGINGELPGPSGIQFPPALLIALQDQLRSSGRLMVPPSAECLSENPMFNGPSDMNQLSLESLARTNCQLNGSNTQPSTIDPRYSMLFNRRLKQSTSTNMPGSGLFKPIPTQLQTSASSFPSIMSPNAPIDVSLSNSFPTCNSSSVQPPPPPLPPVPLPCHQKTSPPKQLNEVPNLSLFMTPTQLLMQKNWLAMLSNNNTSTTQSQAPGPITNVVRPQPRPEPYTFAKPSIPSPVRAQQPAARRSSQPSAPIPPHLLPCSNVVPVTTACISSAEQTQPKTECAAFKMGTLPTENYCASHFFRGTVCRLGNGRIKKVEDISTDDILSCAPFAADISIEWSLVADLKKAGPLIKVLFKQGDGAQAQTVWIDLQLEHPFMVIGKGWSSGDPKRTQEAYGLECQQLKVGDICVVGKSRSAEEQAMWVSLLEAQKVLQKISKNAHVASQLIQPLEKATENGRKSAPPPVDRIPGTSKDYPI